MSETKLHLGLDAGELSLKVALYDATNKALFRAASLDMANPPLSDIGSLEATLENWLSANSVNVEDLASISIAMSSFRAVVKKIIVPPDVKNIHDYLVWYLSTLVNDKPSQYFIDYQLLVENEELGHTVLLIALRKEWVDSVRKGFRNRKLAPQLMNVDVIALMNLLEAAVDNPIEQRCVVKADIAGVSIAWMSKDNLLLLRGVSTIELIGRSQEDAFKILAKGISDQIAKAKENNDVETKKIYLCGDVSTDAMFQSYLAVALPNVEIQLVSQLPHIAMPSDENETVLLPLCLGALGVAVQSAAGEEALNKIHLNLIEVAEKSASSSAASVQPLRVLSKSKLKSGKRTNFKTVLVGVCFVVVAFVCYMIAFGCPVFLEGVIPNTVLDAVGIKHTERVSHAGGAGTLAAKRNAMAMEREKANRTLPVIVDEVQPVMFKKKDKRTLYKDLYPLEKVQYQKATFAQLMAFLQTATPENTGFSDIVYEAPNYYYIRGNADAPLAQRAFLDRLHTVSIDFKSPESGKENATDITAFGTLRMENVQYAQNVNKFVPVDSVKFELQKLQSLEGAEKIPLSGLDKPRVEDFGVYKHYTYNVHALSNFVQLGKFVASWKDSDVRLGARRVSLSRSGKNISVNFIFDMYVTP